MVRKREFRETSPSFCAMASERVDWRFRNWLRFGLSDYEPSVRNHAPATSSGRSLGARDLWLADKLFKESPVVDHCLAQLFGAGLPKRLPHRDAVTGAIIFHNQWMIHRNICGTLFKIAYRIAAQ